MRQDCSDEVLHFIRENNNVPLHVLPVVRARRSLVVNGELGDAAEGGLEGNQPLLDGREAIELFWVSVLASDIHIVDRARLRQISMSQTGLALAAYINLGVAIRGKTLPAPPKGCCGL